MDWINKGKGQSFVIGAVIFSLLATLVFLSTGPELLDPGIKTRNFFSQTLQESGNTYNTALKQNTSVVHIRRRMQSYDRFLDRQSLERGIEYSSYSLIIHPDRGEAAFLNMFPENLEVKLRINGDWHNRTVAPKQGFSTSFKPGIASVHLKVKDREENYRFDSSTPKLVKHSVMVSSGETWENTLVG